MFGTRRMMAMQPNNKALLATLFNGAGDDVGIIARIRGGDNFQELYQHIGNSRYAKWSFQDNYLATKTVQKLWRGYKHTSIPAVTLSGSWTHGSGAGYPGGGYSYCGTTGAYLEFTTPAGCDRIGILFANAMTNEGAQLVTIDGSPTLATGIPTAQDLVTAGALANTCLIAFGGTLNPTDRILDFFNPTTGTAYQFGAWDAIQVLFNTALTPGSHVIRITVTGYHNVACSNNNLFYHLITCGGDSSALRLNSGGGYPIFTWLADVSWTGLITVDNVSYGVVPTGATNPEWMGHTGSFVQHSAAVTQIDGSTVTLSTNAAVAAGSTASYAIDGGFRHSEIGAVDIANFNCTYTLDKTIGLTIAHTTTWLLGGVYGTGARYPAMMYLNRGVFDRFTTFGFGSYGDLPNNDGSSQFSKQTLAGYAWDADGYLGALMTFPLPTVNNWAIANSALFWIDVISAGAWKKLYASIGAGTYTINDVWTSSANYRVAWFPGGANAVLSGF